MMSTQVPIDVICQHTAEGDVIPIKIRVRDEEGEYQNYKIIGYKNLSHGNKEYQLANGVMATSTIIPYECKISTFGRELIIMLNYNSSSNIWTLSR